MVRVELPFNVTDTVGDGTDTVLILLGGFKLGRPGGSIGGLGAVSTSESGRDRSGGAGGTALLAGGAGGVLVGTPPALEGLAGGGGGALPGVVGTDRVGVLEIRGGIPGTGREIPEGMARETVSEVA